MLSELLRVGPGPVDLSSIDPRSTPGLSRKKATKEWTRDALVDLDAELADQQERLYAAAKATGTSDRILLVLQAMDCGGKDGTIKHVVGAMNPQGTRITAFGRPTKEELDHHFLWRIKRALPVPGQVGVFNRSHYEDVLIVRVHNLVPARTWRARYQQINRFERELTAQGVTVVKVMLHISYAEQGARLLARLDDPTKRWKYNPDDVAERGRWDDYQAAYADALTRCGEQPWFVVPADRKWYRNWAVTNLLIEALRGLDLEYPPAKFDVAAERDRVLRSQ